MEMNIASKGIMLFLLLPCHFVVTVAYTSFNTKGLLRLLIITDYIGAVVNVT